PELQKDLVDELIQHEYFKQMHPVLIDALEAHGNGKYSLSIPTLFLLIDGAIVEYFTCTLKPEEKYYKCTNKGCGKCMDICPYCKEKLDPPKLTAGRIAKKLVEKQKINYLYDDFSGARYIARKYGPKRSPVLHGSDKEYFKDRELSTILVFTLSSLSSLIEEHKKKK
ncbi:MAG: hypothetical protein ABII22_04710, partial [Candidatus Micrarchaeota archaeon]